MTRHLVIPDTQVKPDMPNDHLYWAGRYAAATPPDRDWETKKRIRRDRL